jgi:hypothetical protein
VLDLLLVVADKSIEQALRGILSRPHSLGIRPLTFDVRVHPGRDPGCYETGHELAALSAREAEHALVVFDLAWQGAPATTAQPLEELVEQRLAPLWGTRGRCVVIAPELEVWVWSDSPHVGHILGWADRQPSLRAWLTQQGLWSADALKPTDPKGAFERAIAVSRIPLSSAIFRLLAEKVSLAQCHDSSFARLATVLRAWFSA